MSVYSLRVNDSVVINDVMMNNGGVYTVMVDRSRAGYVSMLSFYLGSHCIPHIVE